MSRLRKIRKSRNLSQRDLTELTNLEKSAVSRYERFSLEKARVNVVEKLADALNVSPSYLLGWSDEEGGEPDGVKQPDNPRLIKFKDNLSVVDGLTDTNRLVYSREGNPIQYLSDPETYVLIHSKDDSMAPEIQEGSILFVDQKAKPKLNDYLAIFVDGVEYAIVRILDRVGDMTIYKPLNPAATVYTDDDKLRIVGRVVSILNKPSNLK